MIHSMIIMDKSRKCSLKWKTLLLWHLFIISYYVNIVTILHFRDEWFPLRGQHRQLLSQRVMATFKLWSATTKLPESLGSQTEATSFTSPGRCNRVLWRMLAGNAKVVSSLPTLFNITVRGLFFTDGQKGLLCNKKIRKPCYIKQKGQKI